MGAFNTVGLEAVIESFSKREQATVSAVPKMLKQAQTCWWRHRGQRQGYGYRRNGWFCQFH